MTTSTTDGTATEDVVDWTDCGEERWSSRTGTGAAIDCTSVDMTVEVPCDSGPQAPSATWELDGTLRITTTDRDSAGAGCRCAWRAGCPPRSTGRGARRPARRTRAAGSPPSGTAPPQARAGDPA